MINFNHMIDGVFSTKETLPGKRFHSLIARVGFVVSGIVLAVTPVAAQFGYSEPIVLPAARAMDATAVYSAERMDAQMQNQLRLREQQQMEATQMEMRTQMMAMQEQLEAQQDLRNVPVVNDGAATPKSDSRSEPGEPDAVFRDDAPTINAPGSGTDVLSGDGTYGDAIQFESSDGSGEVYEEGYDRAGFWHDLECDCPQCRRRYALGTCLGWCMPDFGGWLAGGFYSNAHGGNGSFGNAPLGFNNIDGGQLNQAWIYADRAVTRGDGWDLGYRLDFMFGADGQDTQAFGDGKWDESWDTSGQYGFAMPQLYVEGAYGNTSVKLGHFFTIIGYEVVTAPDNFFYSHTYTMYNNEPFTHTGILATHDWTDTITLNLGYTLGWDTGFSNKNDGATFLGGFSWSPSEYFSLIYATTFGDPGDDPLDSTDTYMHSIVVDTQLTDNIEWVLQSDFQNRQSNVADGRSYGLVNYLFYEWDQWTSIGFRYEWFRDRRGTAAVAGASEHFHAITLGLNRGITERLKSRSEVRFDWASRDDEFPGKAFDSGTQNSQMTFGTEFIWTF